MTYILTVHENDTFFVHHGVASAPNPLDLEKESSHDLFFFDKAL